MAISWGPYETAPSPGGTSGMRVGFEASWSSVSNTSTSVTLTVKVYTQNYLTYLGDSQVINFGGSAGSGWSDYSFSNSSGTSPVLRVTKTYKYTYSSGSYGTSPGTRTVSAVMSGVFDGTTAGHSITVTIPARPFAKPAAVSGVNAVRNSDSQATVSWTRHATTAAPYTSQTVAMRTYSGSSWTSYAVVATVSGSATSYVKTGLSANRLYQFEVRANNSVGSSSYVQSSTTYVATTPAAPSNVVSSVNAAGTQITTTWKNNHYVYNQVNLYVERSVNGGAYAVVASGLAYNTTSWLDPSPGAGTNQYRVRARVTQGALFSAYGTGNVVTTIVPPLAPTQLSPNGVAVDLANAPVTLTWKHNPGTDGAVQSHFTIETSDNGGSSWNTLANNVASATSAYTIPAGTLANGATYLWRVKTQGATGAAFGPNSANATFIGSSTPTATITAPGDTITQLPITLEWDYNQDELSPQSAWEAEILGPNVENIEFRSGTTESATTFESSQIVDAVTYILRVRVKSGAGIWSDWDETTTTVHLPFPAAVITDAEYRHETGTVILTMEGGEPEEAPADRTNLVLNPSFRREDDPITLRRNLVQNPSFEVDLTGWEAGSDGSGLERDTSRARSGDASLKITATGVTSGGCLYNMTGLRPGVAYAASVWYYLPTTGGPNNLRLNPQGGSVGDTVTTKGAWTQSFAGFVPTTSDWIMYTDSPDTSFITGSAWVDDLLVYEAPANLITNPSFEVDTSGWVVNSSTIARSTAQHAGSGVASLQVTCTTINYSGATFNNSAIPVTPGKAYSALASIRPAFSGGTFRIAFRWRDAGGATITDVADTGQYVTPAANTWVQVGLSDQVAPPGAVDAWVYVQRVTATAGEVFFVDNVRFWEATPGETFDINDYFDGGTADTSTFKYRWCGAANASQSVRVKADYFDGDTPRDEVNAIRYGWDGETGLSTSYEQTIPAVTGWTFSSGAPVWQADDAESVDLTVTAADQYLEWSGSSAAPGDVHGASYLVEGEEDSLAHVELVYLNSSDAVIATHAGPSTDVSVPVTLSVVAGAVAPIGTASVRSRVVFETEGHFTVTQALLEQLTDTTNELGSYFDGDSASIPSRIFEWTGEPDNSISLGQGQAEIPVTWVNVDRRVEGGEWVTLTQNLTLPADFIDPLPMPNGLNEYRVTSVSTAPSYRENDVVQVLPENASAPGADPAKQWVFINYGDAFDKLLRFRSAPEIKVTSGREKAAQRFLGRRKPVVLLGDSRTYQVSVSGQLVYDVLGDRPDEQLWDSPPNDWETMAREAELVCYRDFTGRRIFGGISDVATSNDIPGLGSVSFEVEESDYTERYGPEPEEG